MLTERHLQIFIALAEEQHFGDAARVVGITQPPLSQGLRRLEALVGAKLFERGSTGVELTPAGAALLPFARRALTSIEELHQAAVLRDPEGPEIRLGLAPEVPPAAGAALAAACGAAVPGSRVTVVSAPTSALVSQVSSGRLTLAAVLHPTVLDGLEAGPVQLLPTWALAPSGLLGKAAPTSPSGRRGQAAPQLPADPLTAASPHLRGARAADPSVELKLLRGLPVAVRPRAEAPAARDLFLDTLALHRPDGGTVVVTDERAGLAMVAAGQAILMTADPTLAAPGVDRHRLTGDPLPTRIRLVWSHSRTPFAEPVETIAQLTDALVTP
ncbi:LysR family transcriptional regulator [Kribbella sp. NPDC005582]|uniref:LysR family transcriptional regulator n=1 Tax=Kribbella sp. NPDC005582 TaxID=3156893 RepID=UPI0033A0187F